MEQLSEFKQTWWDNNQARFDEFNSWIGDKNAESKVFCRNLIKNNKYLSLLDIGCGPASEFDGYAEEYPELQYLGVDSCKYLYDMNVTRGVPMILSDATHIPVEDSSVDVAFSRHVLEHQPSFESMLTEMIRIGKKAAIHVFYKTPTEAEYITYISGENLYDNHYSINKIETFLTQQIKVLDFNWLKVNDIETVLWINLDETKINKVLFVHN